MNDTSSNDVASINLIVAIAQQDYLKADQALKDGADVNISFSCDHTYNERYYYHLECTPLILASWKGNKNIIQLLISHGASINNKNIYEESVLIRALKFSPLEAIQTLLEYGANVHARDEKGRNALMHAVSRDFLFKETASLLLTHGSSVHSKDRRGMTALSLAARGGNKEAAQFLLENGADIESRDKEGFTPLLHAAASELENNEVERFLIERGANIYARTYNSNSILDISKAFYRDDKKYMRTLKEGMKNFPEGSFTAKERVSKDVFNFLYRSEARRWVAAAKSEALTMQMEMTSRAQGDQAALIARSKFPELARAVRTENRKQHRETMEKISALVQYARFVE